MKRLLVPSAALWWGLQFAFLNPALALLLVSLVDASPADVGWVLAAYNASGFLASLLIPAYADRRQDYLRPMLASAVLTVVLAGALTAATALPVVVISLVVLGGPAGVGVTLLFAHLRHTSGDPAAVVNTRAVVSFAWIAGPPAATFLIAWSGPRAVLVALAGIAYYAAMAALDGPVALITVQVLNAWFFAVIAGTGLALFQRIIPRAGLASGLYANTRRIGAIASGPLIGVAALTTLGYRAVFITCAALTLIALATIRVITRRPPTTDEPPTTATPLKPIRNRPVRADHSAG